MSHPKNLLFNFELLIINYPLFLYQTMIVASKNNATQKRSADKARSYSVPNSKMSQLLIAQQQEIYFQLLALESRVIAKDFNLGHLTNLNALERRMFFEKKCFIIYFNLFSFSSSG